MISLDIACNFWSAAFLPLLLMRSLTSNLHAFKVRDISLRLPASPKYQPTTAGQEEEEEEEGAHEASIEVSLSNRQLRGKHIACGRSFSSRRDQGPAAALTALPEKKPAVRQRGRTRQAIIQGEQRRP